MQVSDVAVQDVQFIHPDSTLAEAGNLLRDTDCGALPVTDADRVVIGILTDRDICLALASADVPASTLTAGETMTRDVHVCHPEDDIHAALELMTRHSIRRLPVCTSDGRLFGIVSINDVLLAAGPASGIEDSDVVRILRSIEQQYREKREARRIEEHPTI